jgi:UDP:flavonoid glycosyltransferase YjiC (YdhE family)
MSTILFVTWDGGGNVPPATAIARELVARGHHVRFLGHASQEAALTDAGFEFVRPTRARDFSSLESNSPVAMMACFGDAGMGSDLLAEVTRRPVDLVVIDCLMFGALHAARTAGLHYAVLEHLYDGYYRRGILRGPMGLNLRVRRLAPDRALESAAARILTTLPDLDPVQARPRLHQVGPVVDVAPRTTEEPLVLVSLSTFRFAGMTECLQQVLDATADLDARVVVTTGPAIDPGALRVPRRAEVHRFVPHVELFPQATVFVGHGGHGSTMQALAHDVPVALMPMDRMTDQPPVARSVAATGAGRLLKKGAPASEIAPVLADLLSSGTAREAAARVGSTSRAMPGAKLGADAIESTLNGAPRASIA